MTTAQDLPASGLASLADAPLDTEAVISDAEYAAVMRRLGITGEPGATVSAFNSSI